MTLHLLTNADVYIPQPMGRANVLVAAGKIVWIGTTIPQLDSTLSVQVTDVAGCRLIPGLIDGHAHITGGGGESGFSSRVPPVPLSRFTSAGVTTVVGLLGTDDTVRTTGSLVAQARALCEEGITAFCHTGGYHLPPTTLTGSIRDDIVHIDRIIGVGEVAISDHRSSQPGIDEMLRVAADAHVAGLMTGKAGVLHLHLGDGPRGLQLIRDALDISEIPARVFNPTHINRRKALFDEALELAARGCTVDITAFPETHSDDEWAADQALMRYLDSGAPPERVTLSSDGGGCLPVFDAQGTMLHSDVGCPSALSDTMRKLLLAGHPLERVLPAFTQNVAKLLRLRGKGQIQVGADADLVILDPDGVIRDVMALGQWHVYDYTQCVHSQFEGGRL